MSLAHVQREVRRFLRSKEAGILCVKGKWGVGKTYAWKTYLNEVNSEGRLGLKAYSYVSLFGLNSLEDLRFSIFENTVSSEQVTSGPDSRTFEVLFAKSTDFGRRLRQIIDPLASIIGLKGASDALFKSAFLAVRDQLICFDDLERRGNALEIRDVLGLASLLKEERRCKIALLLNDEKLDANSLEEFNRQLEKVSDVTLVLNPTPQEAAEIAFGSEKGAGETLRQRVTELGITNIRVITRIQRLVARLTEILDGKEQETLDQAIATVTLGSWAVQQPDYAPSLDFIRHYNTISMALKTEVDPADENGNRWRNALQDYPYLFADEFDVVILDGVKAGYFDEELLKEAAKMIEDRRKQSEENSAFSRVWRDMYHGSLATEDDVFLDALHTTAIEDAGAISSVNINSAIRLLREEGRSDQADEVVTKYVLAHRAYGAEFFDLSIHEFDRDSVIDSGLAQAFANARTELVDSRDPLEVLRSVAERQSWQKADVALMAKQSAADFERFLETLRGTDIRRSIESLQSMSQGGYEGSEVIKDCLNRALLSIGKKSRLRARKVARYGVDVQKAEAPPADSEET